MSKCHEVQGVDFKDNWMILGVDGQIYRLPLAQVSSRLVNASKEDRKLYRVSPSGYGIHWFTVDEDLSIDGLLRLATAHSSQETMR